VGRYLEHSRIYYFANGDGPGRHRYIVGSADLRPRNLDRRVEVLVSVTQPDLQARLQEILNLNLEDDELGWELQTSGTWTRCTPAPVAAEGGAAESPAEGGESAEAGENAEAGESGRNTHRRLQALAIARSRAS